MKKHFYILGIVCTVFFAGCEKEPESLWDYPNVDIAIVVQDAQGRNLLSDIDSNGNPIPGTLRPNPRVVPDMKIVHAGETFQLYSEPTTRASEPELPTMKGFRLFGFRNTAQLKYGEFSRDTREYRGEEFTIDWGNGTTSEVKFDLYTTPNGKEQPTFHYATWVKDASGVWQVNSANLPVVTIVK